MNREAAMVTVAEGVWCDPCLVPLVKALNDGGLPTVASCCGHSERPGRVALADGREVFLLPDFEKARRADDLLADVITRPVPRVVSIVAEHGSIAGHFCGQEQPHEAHTWTSPPAYGATTIGGTYQCAGLTTVIPPGPCWHDSGHRWTDQGHNVRCDLLAGHAGAHQADRPMGGTAVWPNDVVTSPAQDGVR